MTDKRSVLTASKFGSRVAEEEADRLTAYFVQTEEWRKMYDGEVDIIFGAKGSGKSALYSLLLSKGEVFRLGKRTIFLAAENPRGTPAFRELAADPPTTEAEFRAIWKLYFLGLAANYLRFHMRSTSLSDNDAKQVIDSLTTNGLLPEQVTITSRLFAALQYVRKLLPGFEVSATDPSTGLEWTGKIIFNEPTLEQQQQGFLSVDYLLRTLDRAYRRFNITVWLVLDRLDVAFSDHPELEANALRSLFRVYLDIQTLMNIDIKVFLRDDIWQRIIAEGFREASHITRTLNISWSPQALLNLLVRRLVHNDSICAQYGVTRVQVMSSAALQRELFYRVFPAQVDAGKGKSQTFDWMLSRTSDGSRRTAPRELIHLLLSTRDEQLRLYELGHDSPPDENLFDKAALRAALPAVSTARYSQTLCAEHPSLKKFLDKMEGGKTQHSPETLAALWGTSLARATEVTEQLEEVGFFERRGTKEVPVYWVPFLYRDALQLVQGSANSAEE